MNLVMKEWVIEDKTPYPSLGHAGENNAKTISITVDEVIDGAMYYLDIGDEKGECVNSQELTVVPNSKVLYTKPLRSFLGREGVKLLQVRCQYEDEDGSVTKESNVFHAIVDKNSGFIYKYNLSILEQYVATFEKYVKKVKDAASNIKFSLNKLDGTKIEAPTDKQVLQYNKESGLWENKTLEIPIPKTVDLISDLEDVTINNDIENPQLLIKDGDNWENCDLDDFKNRLNITDTDTNKLEDLVDTNVSNPTENQYLVYDAENQKWINKTIEIPSGGASELSALSDVSFDSELDKDAQFLMYNPQNKKWVNISMGMVSNALGSGIKITQYGTPKAGQIIYYEDRNNTWRNGYINLNSLNNVNTYLNNEATKDGQVLTYDEESNSWVNKDLPKADSGFSDAEIKELKRTMWKDANNGKNILIAPDNFDEMDTYTFTYKLEPYTSYRFEVQRRNANKIIINFYYDSNVDDEFSLVSTTTNKKENYWNSYDMCLINIFGLKSVDTINVSSPTVLEGTYNYQEATHMRDIFVDAENAHIQNSYINHCPILFNAATKAIFPSYPHINGANMI